jgi:hypothetical protein
VPFVAAAAWSLDLGRLRWFSPFNRSEPMESTVSLIAVGCAVLYAVAMILIIRFAR